ncbi:MAG: Uncharacterised protein [Halieaceae bacterium]|nr:MAG: Uncharacterised protein [Halieaceae bacterium]
MRADLTKLMHQRVSRQNCPVIDDDVSSEGGVIHQNCVIFDPTVMSNMDVTHNEIVIANTGITTVLHGTPVDGYALANNVVITNR